MEANKHFDKSARNYDIKRSNGILRYLVSKERKLLIEKLNPRTNELILDAGCGSGFYSRFISKLGAKPIGIDISKNMVLIYNEEGHYGVVGDIQNIPFKNKFDKILCAGSLEFVTSPDKALESFNLVLKKEGILVLLYPRNGIFGILYKLYHLSHGVRINLFSNDRINKLMNKNRFKIILNKKANILSLVIVARRIENIKN